MQLVIYSHGQLRHRSSNRPSEVDTLPDGGGSTPRPLSQATLPTTRPEDVCHATGIGAGSSDRGIRSTYGEEKTRWVRDKRKRKENYSGNRSDTQIPTAGNKTYFDWVKNEICSLSQF